MCVWGGGRRLGLGGDGVEEGVGKKEIGWARLPSSRVYRPPFFLTGEEVQRCL